MPPKRNRVVDKPSKRIAGAVPSTIPLESRVVRAVIGRSLLEPPPHQSPMRGIE